MESGCARLHVVTTGNGEGDAFAALYENAIAGRGAYRTLFIPSDADPRRDARVVSRATSRRRPTPRAPAASMPAAPRMPSAAPEGVYFKRFSRERHVRQIAIVANWQTYRGHRLRLPPPRLSVGAALAGGAALHRR